MRDKFLTVIGLLASVLLATAAHAERKVALVVGNAIYANTQALKNPTNDAKDIAAELKKLGFDVLVAIDVDQANFARQIEQFGRQLDGADVGLFYYAGHGLQVNEKNYLVSTNAKLESEFLVPSETIDLTAVIRLMESRAPVNLVFLDACRNNPLAETLRRRMVAERRAVSLGRGLAKVDPTGRDTLVAFSAAPGQEASDGEGRNSPFTQAILRHINEPGLEVSVMLKLVAADVRDATKNGQRPQQLSDMTQAFYFAKASLDPKPAPPVPPLPQTTDRTIELAFWQSAIGANDCGAVRSYITRFPDGAFIDLAKLAEGRLCKPAVTPAARAAPEPPAPAIAVRPPATGGPPPGPVIAARPPATEPPAPGPSPEELARNLQKELIRVGCGPSLKVTGEWDGPSRAALTLYNRYGKAKFSGPSPEAIAALHDRNDRICPLTCGRGMMVDGDTCVAIPARPAPEPKRKEAARPHPSREDRAPPRARPSREDSRASREDSRPPRPRPGSSAGPQPGFAPEGGQQRGTRANNSISTSPFTSGGRSCHTLDVAGLAPRIVCP